MSALRDHLGDYLAMRRALGYKLARVEPLLGQFIDYLDERGQATITTAHAVAWVTSSPGTRGWWALRLSAVRGFAGYLHTLDERCEVPPSDLFAPRSSRPRVPYLYTDEDLQALLAAAGTLRFPLRVATFRTLIGLLAVTGMRIGELIAADEGDVDLAHGRLLVRHGKFGKQRRLPLHPTTVDAVAAYLRRPDRPRRPEGRPLLVSMTGTRLIYSNVSHTFVRLVGIAGLPARSERCHARPHDLRHSFAVRTLLDWFGDGEDVDARLPLLSTYLGHANPKDTYWYLTATPELLALAGQRLQDALGEGA